MTLIRDRIAAHCPEGVEYKSLADVGELIRGRRFTKADYVEAGLGLGSIHYGEIYTSYGTSADRVHSFVRPDLRDSLRLARRGDVIVAATGESVDEVGKAVAWLGNDEVAVHDDCYIFRHDLDPRFVAYFFQSSSFQEQKTRHVTDSKLARLSGKGLSVLRIPVPPVEVQREIASVLEKMERIEGDLGAQLAAELDQRQGQYEHFRTLLLTERHPGGLDGVLSDFVEMKAGKFIPASEVTGQPEGDRIYPCYGGGGLRGYVGVASHEGPRALIGRQGALCGNVKLALDGPFYATEHAVVATPKAGVDTGWLYHKLVEMRLNQYATKSAQPGLSVKVLANLPLHVPPMEEQEEVAHLLTRFHAQVTDLSSGLSAEIAARRKQYEYYRDLLLTFPEKTT